VVQGVVFTMVLIVVTLNLLTDILYSVLDPRISS
jgi:peptide/nickel transport system permease protein